MTLDEYLNKCLKDEGFRKAWEEEVADLFLEYVPKVEKIEQKRLSVQEALDLLNDEDLENILKNKGIHPTEKIPIRSEIILFEAKNNCPVENFINTVSNDKLRAKILKNIYQLAIEGDEARPPLSKYVGDGIFELRSKQANNITRIFYFFVVGNKIIMTNGYLKKADKMDKSEFERAKRNRDIYMKRFK